MKTREGQLDVLIIAGPGVNVWPSIGVPLIAQSLCDLGLSVGCYGGRAFRIRGVIPLPSSGGLVLIEDPRHRLHRIEARAIVKLTQEPKFPAPFLGWHSPGLIPLATAKKLLQRPLISWDPLCVILGTSNPALDFGSTLLSQGVERVLCIETREHPGVKNYAAWEVKRRQFEIERGKIIHGQPLALTQNADLSFQLKLKDHQGVRVIESISRVVSAGHFLPLAGFREYPQGSKLFELEQTAGPTEGSDPEGFTLERERSRLLTSKIAKALLTNLSPLRESLDAATSRAKNQLKKAQAYLKYPFELAFEGKWLNQATLQLLQNSPQTPKFQQTEKAASIECFETIGCNLCAQACPTQAIEILKTPVLHEDRCTACGLCLPACPANAITLLKQSKDQSLAELTLSVRGTKKWKVGENPQLVNRRGEPLALGRIIEINSDLPHPLIHLSIPQYLLWEARGIRRSKPPAAEDTLFLEAIARSAQPTKSIEILLAGERRRTLPHIPLTLALFEMGYQRAEDILFCEDGSCGRCSLLVDGVKQLACVTPTRQHQIIDWIPKSSRESTDPTLPPAIPFCPCLQLSEEHLHHRIKEGHLHSPEAILATSELGSGSCHGLLCHHAFKLLLQKKGLDAKDWIDWRFPASPWPFSFD